jgi:hypothetical protein
VQPQLGREPFYLGHFNRLKERAPLLQPKLRLPYQAFSCSSANQRLKSVTREIRTLRSVGGGAGDCPRRPGGTEATRFPTAIATVSLVGELGGGMKWRLVMEVTNADGAAQNWKRPVG